jgi:hypothetical protein
LGGGPAESKSNPKSKSESESGDVDGDAEGSATGAAETGVPPKRSRNGESMSSVVSTAPPRGRTGCGAWKTPTAPWPGAATSSSGLVSEESAAE